MRDYERRAPRGRPRVSGWLVSPLLFAFLGGCFLSCPYGEMNPLPQVKTYHEQGMALLAAGRPDQAVKKFELGLSIQPLFVPSKAHLGLARFHMGQYDRALLELNDTVASMPDYADTYNYLGLVYEAKGDYARAEQQFTLAIDTYPGYADAHFNRARLYEGKMKRQAQALADYETAASFASAGTDDLSKEMIAKANTAAGLIYVRNGVLREAENKFQIAIDTGITIPEASLGFGEIKIRKEQYFDAIVAIHDALLIDKKEWLRESDHERAKRSLALAHKRAPKHVARALVDYAKDKYDALNKLTGKQRDEAAPDAYKLIRKHLLYSASKIDPKQIDAHVLKARMLLDEGDIMAAGRSIRSALKIDKRHKQARFMLASIYIRRAQDKQKKREEGSLEDWAKAEKVLRGLRREEPDDFTNHNLLGVCYFNQEKLRRAEREWREALKCEASEEQVEQVRGNLAALLEKPIIKKANELNDLGVTALSEGKLEVARTKFKQALAYDSQFAVAHTNLGLVHFEEGDVRFATVKVNEALKLDPDLHVAHILKARIHKVEKRLDLARKSFEDARRLVPGDPRPHFRLAELAFEEGKLKDAKTHINRGIAFAPDHYPSQVLLAEVYLKEGLTDNAETQLKLAVENSEGQYAPAFFALGKLYLQLGRHQEAIDVSVMAHEVDKARPEPFMIIAAGQEAQGQPGSAAEALRVAAGLMHDLGQHDEAVDALARAVRLVGNNSELRRSYGLSLAFAGSHQDAIQELREALNLDPNNLKAQFDLATVYEEIGRPSLAAEQFRKVIKAKGSIRDRKNADEIQAYWLPRYRLALLFKPGMTGGVAREEAVRVLHEALDEVTSGSEAHRLLRELLNEIEGR